MDSGIEDSVLKQEHKFMLHRKAFPLKIRLKENPNPASVKELPSTGVIFRVNSVSPGTC